jgi:hypothetical protein
MRSSLRAILTASVLGGGLAAAQEEGGDLTVRWPTLSSRERSALTLEGEARLLPEGAILTLSIHKLEALLVKGRLISELTVEPRVGMAVVREGRFTYSRRGLEPVEPGDYRVVIEIREECQKSALAQALRTFSPRKWEFSFQAWRDDLVDELGPWLTELDRLAEEALRFVDGFESIARSCKTDTECQERLEELQAEVRDLTRKTRKRELLEMYPVATRRIERTVQHLWGMAYYLAFSNGKFAGPSAYYIERGGAKSGEDYTFDDFRKDLEGAKGLAGREFALWVVKDFARFGAREALTKALEAQEDHPAVSKLAERLKRMISGEEDPANLEKDIRDGSAGNAQPQAGQSEEAKP